MMFSLRPILVSAVLAAPVYAAADTLPWEAMPLPESIVQSALKPDRVFCETPCEWREPLEALFRPFVRDCSSAREAVLKIASNMTAVTGVYYSTDRRKPDMNALEALAEKKVSCTGQSILLVCALRAVGIPARVVWVMTWNHVPGNHTWAEAWVDGAWQMIEFNEKDFNTPWVMEGIGMLDTTLPQQRVYAVGAEAGFPGMPLHVSDAGSLLAEDVTDRYLSLARRWYAESGLREDYQRILVDIVPRSEEAEPLEVLDASGKSVYRTTLPTLRDDMRRFATIPVPRKGCYILRTRFGTQVLESTPQPVRIIRIQRQD